ncbi:MAG TPA: TolC family protein [Paludibaculum sp.]
MSRLTVRQSLAIVLSATFSLSPALAQNASIEPIRPTAFVLQRPYMAVEVPPARLADSQRLGGLLKAGKLYLTADDAVALALENNIDIEVSRYSPISAIWRLTRAEAGGALPGVPSGSQQASSVASGQGVLGSQQAAGVGGGGGGAGGGGNGGNASISQVGPVTQNLDPTIRGSVGYSHRSVPQPNNVQSATPVLVQDSRFYNASIQQGFLTGGTATVTYNQNYLKENSPTNVLNPSVAPRLQLSFQHNLLRGFGVAVNARNITVAKNNLKTTDLNFRTQVIATVVRTLNAYYALVASHEDLKSKQAAYDAAAQLLKDSKRQVEIGTMAGADLIKIEAQVATARLNFVNTDTTLQQQELTLKSLLSRTGISDPLLAVARIVPLDRIVMPEKDEFPALPAMVETALANRADLAAQRANIVNSELSTLGTKSGIKPTVVAFGNATNAGLAGTGVQVPGLAPPNPYFVGGLGTALGQVFRRNFPSQSIGIFAQAPIGNRQAQSDLAIDQLQLRQTELSVAKDVKQTQVDVLNAVVSLQQARARYESAVKNRILAEQLLKAEQRKFSLGASTPYEVIQQQRDLTTAQSNEVATLVTHSNARIRLDQTLGTILETNHISLADVLKGQMPPGK